MSAFPNYLINGNNEPLSPLDRGFAYGDGVFRTLPIHHGKPDCWALHYSKLVNDCKVLSITCPEESLLLSDIERLFGAFGRLVEPHAVAKIIVTRGVGERGYALPKHAMPNRMVIKSNFPNYHAENNADGVKLHLCETHLGLQPKLAGIKHLNRLENVLARMEWQDKSVIDGLMLDINGYVIECTSSNVFARFNNKLVTPDLSECGVTGVTRQRIIDAAPSLGLVPTVQKVSLTELLQADEVIICNSLFGAWQVAELDNKVWLTNSPTQHLAQDLRKILLVSCD